MLPASPAGAAAGLPDAIEEKPSFEFAETEDVEATAPAPTLRKSRRVVFISTPPGDLQTSSPSWRVARNDAREVAAGRSRQSCFL